MGVAVKNSFRMGRSHLAAAQARKDFASVLEMDPSGEISAEEQSLREHSQSWSSWEGTIVVGPSTRSVQMRVERQPTIYNMMSVRASDTM